MTSRLTRFVLALAVLAAFPSAARAQWGYARVIPPNLVDAQHSKSSTGQPIQVQHLAVGVSEVTFQGLGLGSGPWGNVQVTTSTGVQECKVESLKPASNPPGSPGTYQVTFSNLGGSPLMGNVQVTAQGFKGEYCNAAEFVHQGAQDLAVYVHCYTAAGTLADMKFLILLEQ